MNRHHITIRPFALLLIVMLLSTLGALLPPRVSGVAPQPPAAEARPQAQPSAPLRAQTGEPADENEHILIDMIDMVSLEHSDIEVLSNEKALNFLSTESVSQTWKEALTITFLIHSNTTDKRQTALVNGVSYKFTSPYMAENMLLHMPNDNSLLGQSFIQSLTNNNLIWRVWYQTDNDGLPTYQFFLARKNYVFQVNIITGFEEEIGQSLLNFAAMKIYERAVENNKRRRIYSPIITSSNYILRTSEGLITYRPNFTSESTKIETRKGDYLGVILVGHTLEFYVEWHRKGALKYQFRYEGLGGRPEGNNDITCIAILTGNGCIDKWYWAGNKQDNPEHSYLGIPKAIILGSLAISVAMRVSLGIPVGITNEMLLDGLRDPKNYVGQFPKDDLPSPTATPVRTPNPNPTTTPVPNPTPTIPPPTQGVSLISAWPQGSMGAKGQTFNPDVTIQTSGFSLDCTRSFLENRDGNLYSTHPIQGCTALGGNRYRFFFNTPMKAPDGPGEYHSKWQVWNGSAHIGPQIDLWFRVAREPAQNRPPARPTLRSPGDLSEIRDSKAPELCWNPVSDPDGDSVQYYAEVFDSARIANSGWISGTCWRPSSLDGQYFGYQWRVKARDERGAESGYTDRWRFTLSPPPYNPPPATSTPLPLPTQPPINRSWWDTAYAYRRILPIRSDSPLTTGTLIKMDSLDLSTLVAQGKARTDRNDLRVVRRIGADQWQEVARVIYTDWDLEFQLQTDLPPGTDASYYLYYGNPKAGTPPTFSLPQGWWVDLYTDKWWSSLAGTWAHNQAMDFIDVCEPPISHRQRTGGSAFDDSDRFRGRLFIPTSGTWTFGVYTNDGYGLSLNGGEIGRFDGYTPNRWVTIGTADLKAGWHVFELRNMWVNCGAWKFSMAGPNFNQIVPAEFFQQVWGNVRTGITPGFEETQAQPVTSTPSATATPTWTATPVPPTNTSTATPTRTPTTIATSTSTVASTRPSTATPTVTTASTATPTRTSTPPPTPTPSPAPWWLGDGRDGTMPASGNLDSANGFGLGAVSGAAGATLVTITDQRSVARINPGDYVLLHQTRGDGAGTWELARMASDVSGSGTFALVSPLQHTYSTSGYQNQAQIIRVPQYAVCNVTGVVTPLLNWNGSVGGIFAVMCQGTLTVSGNISADGYGFRGGQSGNGYRTDQWQGESIASPGSEAAFYYQRPDRFPSAQGGGAADGIGGGGGGGGFFSGSDGDHISGSGWGQGGIGHGSADLAQIFFGGGGGGGATSINPGMGYAQSGSGGGLIYLFAQSVSVPGQISARGQQATGIMYDDGTNRQVTAGSGGGGQIFMRVVSGDLGANRVDAAGGPQYAPPPGGGRFGGGAGGNGYIRIEYCSTVSGSSSTVLSMQPISCP